MRGGIERAWPWAVAAGALLMAAGTLLPWLRFVDAEGVREAAGWRFGLGQWMLALALATGAGPFLPLARRLRLAVPLACAAVALLVAGHFAFVFTGELHDNLEAILRAEYGAAIGVAVSAAGAALALVACVWALWRGEPAPDQ